MSPLATVCHRHRTLVPMGDRCPACKREEAERGKPRRQANHERLGRKTRHWRELSFRMIRRYRATLGPVCPCCGAHESEDDPGSKLTLDLVRGGAHETAREEECEVKCRRCHGREQGGRGRIANDETQTSPLAGFSRSLQDPRASPTTSESVLR